MFYKVYYLDFFDESIGENNVAGCCLSKNHAHKQSDSGECWVESITTTHISDILKRVWYKSEVNDFIKENPETIKHTYLVYKENWQFGQGRNWEEYSPLKEKREQLLNSIL